MIWAPPDGDDVIRRDFKNWKSPLPKSPFKPFKQGVSPWDVTKSHPQASKQAAKTPPRTFNGPRETTFDL